MVFSTKKIWNSKSKLSNAINRLQVINKFRFLQIQFIHTHTFFGYHHIISQYYKLNCKEVLYFIVKKSL